MAKILLGASILLTLLTAVLGFMTKGKVDGLQSNLEASKASARTALMGQQKAEDNFKKAQGDLTTAKTTLEARETENAKLKGDADQFNKKLAEANTALEAKTQELAAIKAELDKISNTPGGVKTEELVAKMSELQKRATDAETRAAEADQVRNTLEERARTAEEKAQKAQKLAESYQGPIRLQGVSGKVQAYNPGWNFVVLSVGDRHGIRTGMQLVVTRGGQRVAKVRVTSVEPQSSIADVMPGTLGRGDTVQPGDTVVVESRH